MATRNEYLFLKGLSGPISSLLTDPLSELTRKRQTALLITATVTLLLSAGLLKLREVALASFKFAELKPPQLATWLAFAVTVYLLAVYLLGVRADWAIAKAKRWSPLAKIEGAIADMNAAKEAIAQEAMKLAERGQSCIAERDRIEADMQKKIDELHRQSEIADAAMYAYTTGSKEELGRLFVEAEEAHSAEWAARQELEDAVAPFNKEIRESLDLVLLEDSGSVGSQRVDLGRSMGAFSRLTKLRVVLEIIFPAAYAVFSLVWTVVHA